jgi:hypothetical protein
MAASNSTPTPAPQPQTPRQADAVAGDENGTPSKVQDTATEHLGPDEVANAAASSLHGEAARREMYVQPAASELPGGNTLIADSSPAEAAREGDKR